jgi:hypothetical protein
VGDKVHMASEYTNPILGNFERSKLCGDGDECGDHGDHGKTFCGTWELQHRSTPHFLFPLRRLLPVNSSHPRITIMEFVAGKEFPRAADPCMGTMMFPGGRLSVRECRLRVKGQDII